jgi:hypothetical protein
MNTAPKWFDKKRGLAMGLGTFAFDTIGLVTNTRSFPFMQHQVDLVLVG